MPPQRRVSCFFVDSLPHATMPEHCAIYTVFDATAWLTQKRDGFPIRGKKSSKKNHIATFLFEEPFYLAQRFPTGSVYAHNDPQSMVCICCREMSLVPSQRCIFFIGEGGRGVFYTRSPSVSLENIEMAQFSHTAQVSVRSEGEDRMP